MLQSSSCSIAASTPTTAATTADAAAGGGDGDDDDDGDNADQHRRRLTKRQQLLPCCGIVKLLHHVSGRYWLSDHVGGPGGSIGPVCVYVCLSICDFDLDSWRAGLLVSRLSFTYYGHGKKIVKVVVA